MHAQEPGNPDRLQQLCYKIQPLTCSATQFIKYISRVHSFFSSPTAKSNRRYPASYFKSLNEIAPTYLRKFLPQQIQHTSMRLITKAFQKKCTQSTQSMYISQFEATDLADCCHPSSGIKNYTSTVTPGSEG